MGVASWILLVWLLIQVIGKAFGPSRNNYGISVGLGIAGWFAGMVYLIYLSGGWQ